MLSHQNNKLGFYSSMVTNPKMDKMGFQHFGPGHFFGHL
jgi:hypothetical protein